MLSRKLIRDEYSKDVTLDSMSAFGAAGAMISTSNDITRWVHTIFFENLLPKNQLNEFLTTVSFNAPPKPPGSRYGLGIYYSHDKKYGDILWYSGVTNGFISLFMYLPKYSLIVTTTINRVTDDNYSILMPNSDYAKGILGILVNASGKIKIK